MDINALLSIYDVHPCATLLTVFSLSIFLPILITILRIVGIKFFQKNSVFSAFLLLRLNKNIKKQKKNLVLYIPIQHLKSCKATVEEFNHILSTPSDKIIKHPLCVEHDHFALFSVIRRSIIFDKKTLLVHGKFISTSRSGDKNGKPIPKALVGKLVKVNKPHWM